MTDPTNDSKVEAGGNATADKIMDGSNAGPSGATGPAQSGPAQTGAAQTGSSQTGAAQTGAAESGPQGATGPAKAPEKYEIKLPEGSLLNADEIGKIESFAKERGLPNEQAQALVDHQSKLLSSYAERKQVEWDSETGKWPDAVKADPEIGGEFYQKKVELAKRVVLRFGSEQFIAG